MDKRRPERVSGDMLTTGHLIDSFEAILEAQVHAGITKPGTLTWYKNQFQKLRNAVGHFPAAELRAHHLVSVRFTHHFIRATKRLFRWAAEEDLIPKDPFKKLKTPRCGSRRRTITRPEMARLYAVCTRSYRRLLMVARYTMARPGEVRRLRWRDIHLQDRLILLYEFKSQDQRADHAEVRRIPIALPLVRLLRNLQARSLDPSPSGYVFTNRFGQPLTGNAVRCAIRRAREKAGLAPDSRGERIVCYSIRHTSATLATRSGVADRRLADILGHTTTRTTARYQHLAGEDLVEAVDQVFARPR